MALSPTLTLPRMRPPTTASHRKASLPGWFVLAPALGLAKVLGWLLSAGWSTSPIGMPATTTALVGTFTVAGCALAWVGRPQPSALRLGALFILTGSAFTSFAPPGALPLRVLAAAQPALFSPAFLWSLGAVLPRVRRTSTGRTFAESMALVSAAAVAVPFAVEAWFRWSGGAIALPWRALRAGGAGWIVSLALSAGAIAYMVVRGSRAEPAERRRVTIFLAGLAAGMAPAVVGTLVIESIPPLEAAVVSNPRAVALYRAVAYAGLMTIPFTTMYAVLVRQALGMRDVAYAALRVLVARQVAWGATLLPLAALTVLLVGGTSAREGHGRLYVTVAVALAALGALALRHRTHIISWVDGVLFPENVLIDEALLRLERDLAEAPSLRELVGGLRVELDRVLGFSRGCCLMEEAGVLVAPAGEVPPLAMSPEMGAALRSGEVVRMSGRLHLAGDADQDWAAATGCDVLVPVPTPPSFPLTVIGTGEKTNELPVTAGDLKRLRRIGAAVGIALGRLEGGGAGAGRREPRVARECAGCGRVTDAGEWCAACGDPLRDAPLPRLLGGKFDLVRRLGQGGTGVVYEARDVDLGRHVAVKTFSASSGDPAALRAEGRFMAGLSHPALATIYSIETWRGRPVLVLELFEKGTLADRLERGALPWREALDLGLALAGGLAHLHDQGVLHGDVKPTNIGFGASGRAKLLDFGLARFSASPPGLVTGGTFEYLPPEWIGEGVYDARGDVWALAVTLYEALVGEHPLARTTRQNARGAIVDGPPSVRALVPDCDRGFAEAIDRCLATDPESRPADGAALHGILRSLHPLDAPVAPTKRG